MKTITKFEDLCRIMVRRVEKKKIARVWISTYGLYLGTYPEGKTYGSTIVRDSLRRMARTCRVTINLCIPKKPACRENCPECRGAQQRQFYNMRRWMSDLRDIGVEVVIVDNVHAKGVAFDDGYCIVGGFNMTASSFRDFAVLIKSQKTCKVIKG